MKKLIYHKFVLRDQIENQKQLYKRVKKKIQKNKNQSGKKKHSKLRFKDEIKKNQNFTKEPRAKDKN